MSKILWKRTIFLQPDQVDLNGIKNAQENCKPKRIYRRKNDQEPIDQPETEIAIQEKEIAGLTLLEYGQRNSRPSKANKNAQDEPDQQVKELVTGYSLSDKCNILPVNPKYDERLFDELHDFYIKLFWTHAEIQNNLRYYNLIKFIYSERATKFCEIAILYFSYLVPVKSKVEILQKFVAFSEYMNFKI